LTRKKVTNLNKAGSGVVYWHRLAERDDRHVVLIGSRARADAAWFLVILAFVAAWECFFVFIVSAINLAGPHKTAFAVAFGAFIVIPLCFVGWIGSQMPSLLITRAEFLLQEKVTLLTYFWVRQRRVPVLPSSVEIESHPSKTDCYTGTASLAFAGHHLRIPLLYTEGWFDLDTAAEERAAELASEIRCLLNLEEHLPRHDGLVLSVKDRISSLCGGLFFAGFSGIIFYAAFSSRSFELEAIPGRIIAGVMGLVLGAAALFYFRLALRPNRRRKTK
jgi:hypothetical protein